MSDRELIDITLPSGKVAKVVTFFTRGEVNEISRLSWGDAVAEQQDDGTVKIKNIPVNQGKLDEDAVVLQGTKSIDGVEVDKNLIDSLPNTDFQFLLLELRKVQAGKKNEISKK